MQQRRSVGEVVVELAKMLEYHGERLVKQLTPKLSHAPALTYTWGNRV